jgi:MerR family transcriptional regulator, light-induced transcriptional regulator
VNGFGDERRGSELAHGTVDGELELLTLQEAADRLRVHYMTAYRWVRRGELPAFKAGGRLRVRGGDLDRFLADREVDVTSPARAPRRTEWPTHVDRLTQYLLTGGSVEANGLIRKVVADGAPVGEVYISLLAPALHRVGEEWAAGRIVVGVEHRATEIAQAIMARLSESFRRRGPSRGVAVTLAMPGDEHRLGSGMAADFLRGGGYEVHHLGTQVTIDDLRLFLRVAPADVVAVSITTEPADVKVLTALVDAVRTECPDAFVVAGGQGARKDTVESAGAIPVDNLTELVPRVEALVSA